MLDYIYDGSFDGLLTAIWHHYYTDRAASICTEDRYQPNFLQDSFVVRTEPAKADRVYNAIREKISLLDLRSVYRAWLSCDPNKEMIILRYVVLGFKHGHRTYSLHGNPVVADFQGILHKISQEQERMMQFVRFSVIRLPEDMVKNHSEILYARIEPDNDCLELVARHFCDRFHKESFIIHDVGRDKALIADNGRWYISAFKLKQAPEASLQEKQFRQLWKEYFDHIAIMERKNTRCQNNFIPDRYRKHLTEIITAD